MQPNYDPQNIQPNDYNRHDDTIAGTSAGEGLLPPLVDPTNYRNDLTFASSNNNYNKDLWNSEVLSNALVSRNVIRQQQ